MTRWRSALRLLKSSQTKRSARHPVLTSASWRCFSLHRYSGDLYFTCPSNSASTMYGK